MPDLRYYKDMEVSFTPDLDHPEVLNESSRRIMFTVMPESERGHNFLMLFNEETQNKYLVLFDGDVVDNEITHVDAVDELHIPPGAEFDMFKRQAELAMLELVEGLPEEDDEP